MQLILLKFLKKNSEISNRFGVIRSFDPKDAKIFLFSNFYLIKVHFLFRMLANMFFGITTLWHTLRRTPFTYFSSCHGSEALNVVTLLSGQCLEKTNAVFVEIIRT